MDNQYSQQPSSNKDEWLITLLLLMFLGSFGVHHFYNKNNKQGFILLACTLGSVITCGISSFATLVIWVLDLIKLIQGNYQHADGHFIVR